MEPKNIKIVSLIIIAILFLFTTVILFVYSNESSQLNDSRALIQKSQYLNCGPNDTDGDLALGLIDFSEFARAYNGSCGTQVIEINICGPKDNNLDDQLTLEDFSYFAQNYLQPCTGVTIIATSIPSIEPTIIPTTSISPTLPPIGSSDGVWISREDLANLPITGQPGCESGTLCAASWDSIIDRASSSWSTADLATYDGLSHSMSIYSGALAAVRLSTEPGRESEANGYYQKTVQGMKDAMGTEQPAAVSNGGIKDGSLAISRQFFRYVISGDIMGLHPAINSDPFAQEWYDYSQYMYQEKFTFRVGDGGSSYNGPPRPYCASNGCMMGAGTQAALAAYLGDTTKLDGAWLQFQRYSGDLSVGNQIDFSSAGKDWYHVDSGDDSNKMGINPLGATCYGSSYPADGVIPNDQGRGDPCPNPGSEPGYTPYPWEGMQGAFAQAIILDHKGYVSVNGERPWEVNDRALLRALEYQWYLQDNYGGEWYTNSRAAWVKHLGNRYYNFKPIDYNPSGGGRIMDYTQWTHPL